MKNRVSNAPVSLTRRYEAHLQSKRRGQALLLAVVVMLFVALISAGFLATVSGNLNQTARTSEKNSAIESAKAGMAFINNRINTSAEGENWRPTFPATLPGGYYSQLAEVQGLVTTPPTYAKYPEGTSVSADAPKFYAKVERIGYSVADRVAKNQAESATEDPEKARAGMLKISVFGLAKNDPYAFHKMVAYRGGYDAAPVGRAMRVVANYDFTTKGVISATVASISTTDPNTVVLTNLKGNFPDGEYKVVARDATTGAIIPTGKISAYDKDTKELTFAATPPTVGAIVELAADLGAPDTIDYDLDTATTATPIPLAATNTTPEENTVPVSAKINGSVYWQGNLSMRALKSKQNAYSTGDAPKTIEASGLMIAPTTVVANDPDLASPNVVPDSATLAGTAAQDVLVSDGRSRILGDLSPIRQTKAFTPPDLSSEANLARYRGLTRDSKSNIATYPEASAYGDGQGIYISNSGDKERVVDADDIDNDGNTTELRDMTQKELIAMWLSTNTDKTQYRLPVAALPATTVTTASLEEKHLRGWVGPDEFKGRGALVEIFNDPNNGNLPTAAITLDALSDGANAVDPDINKTWKTNTGDNQDGIYRRTFPLNTNFNGVIFAEGNIRIKGSLTDTANPINKSLTVVSMGNIYVEGSLSLNPTNVAGNNHKTLLLARKNVVVNPTSVISRPEAYTTASAAAGGTDPISGDPITTLTVVNGTSFKQGDWLLVGTTNTTPYKVVSPPTNTTLVVAGSLTDIGTVRMAKDSFDSGTSKIPTLSAFNGVYQRHISTDAAAAPITSDAASNLIFRHSAEKRIMATMNVVQSSAATPDPLPDPAKLTIKERGAADSVILAANKNIQVVRDPGSVVDSRNLTTSTLSSLEADFNSSRGTPNGDWSYEINLDAAADGNIPAYYLAAQGNRRQTYGDTENGFPWLRDLLLPPTEELIMATRVKLDFGNNLVELGAAGNNVNFFGFANDTGNEDIVTSDFSFYTSSSTTATSYLIDSRPMPNLGVTQGSFSLKLDNPVAPAYPLSDTAGAANRIPNYYIGGMRLENTNAAGAVQGPSATLNIDAYVYAQNGSWFVIPGGYFDDRIKVDGAKSYIDYNGNSIADIGEYVNADNSGTVTAPTFTDGDYANISRAGVADGFDADVVSKYARYNYQINFTGTISENYTAIVDTQVKDWMDKWTTYDPSITTNPNTPLQPIRYIFDDAYVRGILETEPGFYMPVANDITYQE